MTVDKFSKNYEQKKYFEEIKKENIIWDLIEEKEMIVSDINSNDYFPIVLRSRDNRDTASCTMDGYDGVHKIKRYYWTKPQIVGGD